MSKKNPEIARQLNAYLASKGEPAWRCAWLSCRLGNAFGENAAEILGLLEKNAWTYEDIYYLFIKNSGWRLQPRHFLDLQQALHDAGCEPTLSRRLLMEPGLLKIPDAERVKNCMLCMRKLGWSETQIQRVTLLKPRILALTPEVLRAWYEWTTSIGGDPVFDLRTANRHVHKAMDELLASAPPVEKPPVRTAPILPPPRPTLEEIAKPILAAQALQAKKPKVELVKIQKRRPRPKPLRLVVGNPLPNPQNTREYVPDNKSQINWLVLAQEILNAVVPDWNERKWAEWLMQNPWINLECQQTQNLEQILRWMRFSHKTVPRDSRAMLIASILLDRNLALEKRKQKSGKKVRCRIELSPILVIDEKALYLRFYILRRVLDREPMKNPELLALPFEQVRSANLGSLRNLSIPPPLMTGQDVSRPTIEDMQMRMDEIRYRANLLRDKGLKPWLKPYINMLLEPEHAKFARRLERFINKKRSGLQYLFKLG